MIVLCLQNLIVSIEDMYQAQILVDNTIFSDRAQDQLDPESSPD